jgi:hypothetical protein
MTDVPLIMKQNSWVLYDELTYSLDPSIATQRVNTWVAHITDAISIEGTDEFDELLVECSKLAEAAWYHYSVKNDAPFAMKFVFDVVKKTHRLAYDPRFSAPKAIEFKGRA